jgi:hypothetical protein
MEMIIKVRLFGYLAKHCGKDPFKEFEFGLLENSKPEDLLKLLGIPEKEVLLVVNPGGKEKVLTVNDAHDKQDTIELRNYDTIWIYPFLDGG